MFEKIDWSWRDPIIRNMRNHKDPANLIARVVKVGSDSLRRRERQLGLPRRAPINHLPNKANMWSEGEIRILRHMWADNRSMTEILARLPKRSKSAIWTMRKKLNLPSRRAPCDAQLAIMVDADLHAWVVREARFSRMIRSRYLERFFIDLMRESAEYLDIPPAIESRTRYAAWSDEERELLVRMWNADWPLTAIHKHMPLRTIGSISGMRRKMKLEPHPLKRYDFALTFCVQNDLDLWLGQQAARLGIQRHHFLRRCLMAGRNAQIQLEQAA